MRPEKDVNWSSITITNNKEVPENPSYYWSDGKVTTEEARDAKDKVILCAKSVPNKEQVTESQYVLSDGGELFDPQNISLRYCRKNWKFRLVKNKDGFNLYIAYLGFRDENLKGKKTTKLKAERLM